MLFERAFFLPCCQDQQKPTPKPTRGQNSSRISACLPGFFHAVFGLYSGVFESVPEDAAGTCFFESGIYF